MRIRKVCSSCSSNQISKRLARPLDTLAHRHTPRTTHTARHSNAMKQKMLRRRNYLVPEMTHTYTAHSTHWSVRNAPSICQIEATSRFSARPRTTRSIRRVCCVMGEYSTCWVGSLGRPRMSCNKLYQFEANCVVPCSTHKFPPYDLRCSEARGARDTHTHSPAASCTIYCLVLPFPYTLTLSFYSLNFRRLRSLKIDYSTTNGDWHRLRRRCRRWRRRRS